MMDKIAFDSRQALPRALSDEAPVLGRRGFLVSSLAVGFAAAALPVSAETIHTDDAGLIAGEVQIPVADGKIPAYRAYPAEGHGPFPTVVVIQEIFGVHEHIKDLCRRLAKLGYFAISTELYARQGDVSKLSDINEIITKVVAKVPDEEVLSDLDQTVEFARSTGVADTSRLAVTGFCWGGRATWLYAAHNPHVKAAVAWYGLLAPPMWNPKSASVFSVVPKVKAPVLALFGERDTFIPSSDVDKLRAELKGSTSEVRVYPGAQHGFNADYRPSYDPAAAKDAWARMLAWFKANGV